MSLEGYRTLAIDYTGGKLTREAINRLLDGITTLFEAEGLRVEGGSDKPTVEAPEDNPRWSIP